MAAIFAVLLVSPSNWGAYGIRIRNGARGNIVNNVFRTDRNPAKAVLLAPDAGAVHITGNNAPGWNVSALSTARGPLPVAPVTTEALNVAERLVLAGAGARPRDRDDELLVTRARSVRP